MARRGMWIGVGVVALGTALAGVMAPTMAARTLEGKLVAAMSKRELDVRWDKIEVEYGGDVLLHGVRFADELKGVELGVELVRITPALRSLLGDDPRIKRIELEGVRAQGDAIKLKRWWDGRKKGDEDKTKDKESEGGGLSKRLMAGLKASPPTIEAHDVDVALKADGASLASVHAEEGLIDADGQQLSVSGHGMLTLEHARVPDFARAPRGWKLEGSADLEHRAVKMRLGAASAEEALLEVVIPKFGAARVGRVGADISLSEQTGLSAELVVEQGKLLLGEQERPALRVEGAQIMVGMVAGRPKVRAVNASLSVNPKQINRLGEMRAALKGSLGGLADLAGSALGKKADAAKKKKKAPTRQEELEKMGAQLTKLLWAADIEIEQGDIALELGTEDEDLQRIVLVEGLSGVIQRGLVYGRGTSAGGDFQGLASFVPGEVVPQVAWVEARGVDLQKIPGLSEGRSLPSRGIRGKVGGIVDVRMIASTPEQGMHAPGLPGELRAVVEASWRDGVIDLHGLADDPVTGISGTTTMELRLSPKLGMIKLEEGHAQTGELVGSYSASMMDWPWRTVVRLDASLDEADCQSMVDALPRAMLGPYQNVQLMGRAAPTLKFVYPLYDAYKTELEVGGMSEKSPQGWTYRCGVARLNAAPEAQPVLVQGESPRPSMPTLIMTPLRDGGEAYLSNTRPTVHDDVHWLNGNFIKLVQEGVDKGVEIKVGPGVETYVPLSEMPRYVAAAMYLSEEIAFYGNRGISMGLILKALKLDLDRGRFVYGGSTVTQQLVKNMFLTRNKTLARKLQEALIAFRMDEVVSKARILELYLNCIEFGPNVYGIGPAAKYYFNKDARQLTPLESIFLAGLKPSPRYGAVLRKRGKVSLTDPHYSKRTETIFMRMVDYGIVSIEEALKARPYDIRWGAEGVYEGSSGNGMPTAPWPKPGEPLFPIASERPREGNRLEKLMDAGFVVRTPEGLVQPQAPAAPVELLP